MSPRARTFLGWILGSAALVACSGSDTTATGGAAGATSTSTTTTTTTTTSTTTSSTDSTSSTTTSSTTTSSTGTGGTGTGGTGTGGTGTTSSTSTSSTGTGGTGGAAVCGDGIAGPGEPCDDGNTVAGDGCSPACAFEAMCGNGKIEPGESCDDGDTTSNDGCSATCQIEAGSVCGDAVNLNDPAKVTVSGGVTVYQGTTLGSANTTFGPPTCSSGTTGVPRVVHRYRVGGAPAVLHIETVATAGPLVDSVVWAYLDCQSPVTELACSEDTPAGLLGAIDTGWLPAGTTVYIAVAGYSSLDVGAYRLRVTETPAKFTTASGTCAAPVSIGPGLVAGATVATDAHGGSAATACSADAPDAVYAIDVPALSDLSISATTNSTNYDLVVSLLGMPCAGGAEITCADANGAGTGESLFLKDLAAGTYYVVVGGFGTADVGPYALDVDLVKVLSAGAACNAASTTERCATGTICSGGTCSAVTSLLFADFSANLTLTAGDAGNDGQTWTRCAPAAGCPWDNTTGTSPNDPYALVRDAPGVALDGELLTSAALNASALTKLFVAFDHTFEHAASSADLGAVEVSTNGTTWTSIATYTADAQGHVVIDASAMGAGKSAFQVRFRYDDQTNAAADPFANGWRVDNVHVFGL